MDRTVGVEERLTEGRIEELGRTCQGAHVTPPPSQCTRGTG
jgi:hypothetical protein